MNMPAEKNDQTETTPQQEAPKPVLVKSNSDEIQITHRVSGGTLFLQFLNLPLLRDQIFLGVLVLAILNAVIFFHYASDSESSLDLKSANIQLRETLGKDADLLSPVSDFINIHGEFSSPDNSTFETSLARFRSRLAKLGVESSDLFFLDEFIQKNGGLYWSKKADRAPTMYQPVTP